MTSEFLERVLKPIKAELRSVRLPALPKWSVAPDMCAVVELTREQLSFNMQENTAASPLFLLCLVLRLRAAGQRWRALVRLRGNPLLEDGPLGPETRHFARSLYLLQLYRELFPDILRVEALGRDVDRLWQMPEGAVLNQGSDGLTRSQPKPAGHPEYELEAHFINHKGRGSPQEQFARVAGPIGAFRRQLPVGLFSGGVVSKATAVMPTGKSAIDVWATSVDGKTLHLLELKAAGNLSVGTLAEVLMYSSLLAKHRDRQFGPDPNPNSALAAVRGAERITGWFATPRQHPLVGDERDVVIAAFNKGLEKHRISLRTILVTGRPPAVQLSPTP